MEFHDGMGLRSLFWNIVPGLSMNWSYHLTIRRLLSKFGGYSNLWGAEKQHGFCYFCCLWNLVFNKCAFYPDFPTGQIIPVYGVRGVLNGRQSVPHIQKPSSDALYIGFDHERSFSFLCSGSGYHILLILSFSPVAGAGFSSLQFEWVQLSFFVYHIFIRFVYCYVSCK